MKTPTLLLFLLLSLAASAQQIVQLDSCYAWTRNNYPNLQQTGFLEQIAALKKDNLKTTYLPQLMLNGQATYQSDVTSVNVPLPGVTIPKVSKDQYKVYAEIRQNIWDGGLSEANAQLEDAVLNSSLSQLEVELYRLNEQVAQAFFTVLAIEKQEEVLMAQKQVLEEKLKAVKSGIENQVTEQSAAWELEAEILNLDQSSLQLEAARNTSLQMLSVLTGKTIEEDARLNYSEQATNSSANAFRPETELFMAQRSQLETQSELLSRTRYPKIFGFGQAGYGRPGLNMLKSDFDTYYLVGVGVSWNAFDWKKTSRHREMLQLQSQMIDRQEETFNQNLHLLLVQQNEQISKLGKLLDTDEKMKELRAGIVRSSSSKLENGAITTSDYIRDLQAETVARINAEIHRIQLSEAREKYSLIEGKSIEITKFQ